MQRKHAAIALLVAALAHHGSALALDAQSVQSYCDDVKKAAKDAQLRYIAMYKPSIDPGKVFEDATDDCLNFIVNFQLTIPGLVIPNPWDVVVEAAKKAVARACTSARAQFDKAVNDAVQSVNKEVSQIPGASLTSSVTNSKGNGVGVDAAVTVKDPKVTPQKAAENLADKIFNKF